MTNVQRRPTRRQKKKEKKTLKNRPSYGKLTSYARNSTLTLGPSRMPSHRQAFWQFSFAACASRHRESARVPVFLFFPQSQRRPLPSAIACSTAAGRRRQRRTAKRQVPSPHDFHTSLGRHVHWQSFFALSLSFSLPLSHFSRALTHSHILSSHGLSNSLTLTLSMAMSSTPASQLSNI